MMNKNIPFMIVFGIILVLSSAFALANTNLAVSPATKTSFYNDQFTISVNINTDDSVAGAELDVNFNKSVLQAISVADGGFLSQDGVSAFDAGNSVDNTNGKVTFNMIAFTPNTGFNGTGHLANITFKSLVRSGNSNLTLSNAIVGKSNGSQALNVTLNKGVVIVYTSEKVLINEFLAHPSSGNEWVEVYNNDSVSVNLKNWKINDSANTIVDIDHDLIVDAGDLVIFYFSNKLNNAGDTIKLIGSSGSVVDEYIYSSDPGADVSLGRRRDGLSEFISFSIPTPNQTNNRLPTGTIAEQTLSEDGAGSFNMSSYITDADGDSMTLSVINEYTSKVDCNIVGTSNVTLTPAANWNGATNCTIRINDGYGTVNKTFNIVVSSVNDAPTISSISPSTFNVLEGSNLILNITPFINDVDNEKSSLVITENSSYASVSGQVITFNYPSTVSQEKVAVTVSDGSSTAKQDITINVKPILELSDLVVYIDGMPNYADNGEAVGPAYPGSEVSLSVKIKNNYPTEDDWVESIVLHGKIDSTIDDVTQTVPPFTLDGTKNATKELVFDNLPLTINEDAYELNVTASGTDKYGHERMDSWIVYINYTTENREVIVQSAALDNSNVSCYRAANLNVNFVNVGETTQFMNITVSNPALGIAISEIEPIDAKENISKVYNVSVVNQVAPGTYPITVTMKYDDGQGGYTTKTKIVYMTIKNCFSLPDKTLEQDGDGFTYDLYNYVNDSIKADSEFTYNVAGQTNSSLVNCHVDINRNLVCDAPVGYGVSDVNASVTNGIFTSNDIFRITVTKLNHAPVAYDVNVPTFNEDNTVIVNFNCSDVDGDSLSYSAVSNPSHGNLSGSGNSRVYTPNANYNGADSFTYKCVDSTKESNNATVSLNIASVLDNPSIAGFIPSSNNVIVGDGVPQQFSINLSDPDGADPTIEWYVNNELKPGSSEVFTWTDNNSYTLKVNITNATTNREHVWNVVVSKVPITTHYTMPSIPESSVENFTGFYIEKTGVAKIDWDGETMNLNDVVDVNFGVRLENGIVGINSDAPGFSVFKSHPAKITMYGLNSASTPTIYYNSGFSTTGTDVCPTSICSNITYSAGTLTFYVSHFSIFWTQANNTQPPVAGTGALSIDKVDVSEDEPKPDEEVSIEIKVENNGDLDIENINLEIKLLDENGNIVEDSDGDDMEDDDDFDLDSGDDTKTTFKFTMPLDAKDGDEYTIDVYACGRDKNDNKECAHDDSETITIQREKHEVLISSMIISPSTINCFNSADISIDLKDIGREDEDVTVSVYNDALGLSDSQTVELEAEDEDNYQGTANFAVSAPSDLAEGTYQINVKVEYGSETETKTLTLTKGVCEEQLVEEEEEETYDDNLVVVTLDKNSVVTGEQPDKLKPATAANFRDSFEYIILLIILGIVALGVIVFLIGAVMLKQ